MPTIQELESQIAALRAAQVVAPAQPPSGPLKLDLGCGNTTRRGISGMTKEKGWTGVDLPGTDGADVHFDVGVDRWPFADSSVDEVNCAHMVEHLPVKDVEWELIEVPVNPIRPLPYKLIKKITRPRVYFFNELWRVMKPGAKATIVTPHWASCRAYGDPTHEWPAVSEMFWQYMDMSWRELNAPHVGFNCKFEVGYGYLAAAWLQAECANRNAEFVAQRQTEAFTKYKEAAQDMYATLVAKK